MPGKGLPTIMWGQFISPDHIVHIAPTFSDEKEVLMKGHILSGKCPCGPTVSRSVEGIMTYFHFVMH